MKFEKKSTCSIFQQKKEQKMIIAIEKKWNKTGYVNRVCLGDMCRLHQGLEMQLNEIVYT
jgi:hypothetical protein